MQFWCTSWLVSLYRIFKKPLEQIQSYADTSFWSQNGQINSFNKGRGGGGSNYDICPKKNFLQKNL